MTETADASASRASYIGSFLSLVTKSDIRYEGFLFQLNTQDSSIVLRNVKAFGTERRRLDGSQVAMNDKIYEYMYFKGSDIKDLQVVSLPPVHSTPIVHDDPAIIQLIHSHPPSTTISMASTSAMGGTNLCSSAQLGNQVPPFQANMISLQSVEMSGSWASVFPASPVNFNGPAMQSYWLGFTGLPGGISHFQQKPSLPPPQGLLLPNPIQHQLPHPSMNPSLAGNALNVAEVPRALLPPVSTGSLYLISTVSPPSTVQHSHSPISTLFSNLSSASMSNNASKSLPTDMVDSGSQVSSPMTTSDVESVIPVSDQAPSLLGPAPFPMISQSALRFVGLSSVSRGKALIVPPAIPGSNWQRRFVGPSYSPHLKTENGEDKIVSVLASELQPSDSQNFEEPSSKLPESPAQKIRQGVSSSYHGRGRRRRQGQGQGKGDVIYGDVHHHQSNIGHVRGRGQINVLNTAAPQNHQTYTSHPVGRRHGHFRTASYPPQVTRGLKENAPNCVAPNHHHYAGSPALGGGKVVTKFTEDFDFEAMNKKFNKEEIWGLLGKTKRAESTDKKEDEEGDGRDATDEPGDELPKFNPKYGYRKDDFFDSLSYAALDGESGRGKIKLSEQRRIDAETFGESAQPHQDHGFCGRRRGVVSRGSYCGRRHGNAGRGHVKKVWSPKT